MQAKWQGIPMVEVYEEWANVLYGCSFEAIKYAIGLSQNEEHPPSLGQFLAFCQKYRPPKEYPQMIANEYSSDKFTVSKEEGLERINKIKEMIANKFSGNTKAE